jgi:hypothetical protein
MENLNFRKDSDQTAYLKFAPSLDKKNLTREYKMEGMNRNRTRRNRNRRNKTEGGKRRKSHRRSKTHKRRHSRKNRN